MMLMLYEVACLIGGSPSGPDVPVARVVTDSRSIQPGDLFVALQGERFDAHDFVTTALQRGASGAVVSRNFALPDAPLIAVDEPRLALGQLSSGWRSRFHIPLVGITGSNGKTTVKEMLAAILRFYAGTDAVLATPGNFNNDIGLPLTLLSLREQHRYAVIEMGMNHAGEINYLTGIARPNVALINNAMRAHLGHFASVASIARAKAEIFSGLGDSGIAVINRDDASYPLFIAAAGDREVWNFGRHSADVFARDLELQPRGSCFTVVTPRGEAAMTLRTPGEHNVLNALAAVTVALALGIPLTAIPTGLATWTGVKGRLMYRKAANGATVIDDTYNANPDSIKAALNVLVQAPPPRIFVMGDIGELGEDAAALHAEVGSYARDLGIDTQLTLGELSHHACLAFGSNARHFLSLDELLVELSRQLLPNATVLVKGSRFMRMERAVESLCAFAKERE